MSMPSFNPEARQVPGNVNIEPLTSLEYAGTVNTAGDLGLDARPIYRVICRDCGDITRSESGGQVNDAPLGQATLYRQRHLAWHLRALAEEIDAASR